MKALLHRTFDHFNTSALTAMPEAAFASCYRPHMQAVSTDRWDRVREVGRMHCGCGRWLQRLSMSCQARPSRDLGLAAVAAVCGQRLQLAQGEGASPAFSRDVHSGDHPLDARRMQSVLGAQKPPWAASTQRFEFGVVTTDVPAVRVCHARRHSHRHGAVEHHGHDHSSHSAARLAMQPTVALKQNQHKR